MFVAIADRAGVVDGVDPSRGEPESSTLRVPGSRHRSTRECEVAVATVDVDLGAARAKATVFVPGEFEIDVFGDRRPELYAVLTQEQSDA